MRANTGSRDVTDRPSEAPRVDPSRYVFPDPPAREVRTRSFETTGGLRGRKEGGNTGERGQEGTGGGEMRLGRGRTSSPVILVEHPGSLNRGSGHGRSPGISVCVCMCLSRVECRRVSCIEKQGKGNPPKPQTPNSSRKEKKKRTDLVCRRTHRGKLTSVSISFFPDLNLSRERWKGENGSGDFLPQR